MIQAMRRWRRYWPAAAVIACGALAASAPDHPVVLACSCPTEPAGPDTPRQALGRADAVFDGTVTHIEEVDPSARYSDLQVTLRVNAQWKGVPASTIVVVTPPGGPLCGVDFRVGQRYLVYATGQHVSICSRTRSYSAAEAAALGPSLPPALVGHFGGRIAALSADPDQAGIAWIAQGPRVAAVDVNDPAAPRLLGSGLLLPRTVDALAVDAPDAVALSGGRLYVLDVSDPAMPVLRHDLVLEGLGRLTGRVALIGRLAAVTFQADGGHDDVALVDIVTSARSAGLLSEAPGRVADVVAVGKRWAVATRAGDQPMDIGTLRLLSTDVDQGKPDLAVMVLASIDDVVVDQLAVAIVDGVERVYALSGAGLAGWDIVDGGASSDGTRRDVTLREVRRCGRDWRPEGVAPAAGDLAVAPGGDVFVALDRWVGSFYTAGIVVKVLDGATAGACTAQTVHATIRPLDARMQAVGHSVLMAEATGLGLLDAATLTNTAANLVVDAVDAGTSTRGGRAVLHVVSDEGTLAELDPTDPTAPVLTWALPAAYERGSLSVDEGVVGLANYGLADVHDLSIDVIDVTNGAPTGLSGHVDLRDAGDDVRFAQSGRNLVVRSRPNAVALVDVSDPAAPVVRSTVVLEGRVSDIAIDGPRVVVAHGVHAAGSLTDAEQVRVTTLAVLGRGDTLRLERRGEVTVEPFAVVDANLPRITLGGDTAWLAIANGCPSAPSFDLRGVDVDELAAPGVVTRGWEDLSERPSAIFAADGHVFLPGEHTWVVDVRRPRAPRVVGALDTGAPALGAAVHVRTVFVASGASGVYIFQPSLDWASDPTIATASPEAIPSSLPPTPTVDCPPMVMSTVTPTASPFPSPTSSPIAHETAAWLPWAGRAGALDR